MKQINLAFITKAAEHEAHSTEGEMHLIALTHIFTNIFV